MFTILYWGGFNVINVSLYTGPKKYFDSKLEEVEDYVTLSEIVFEYHMLTNKQVLTVDETVIAKATTFKTVVCYSEEFNGISENLMMSFFSRLSMFNVENYYIQNPPIKIKEQVYSLESTGKVKLEATEEFKYETLKEDNIINISKSFKEVILGQNNVQNDLLISLVSLLNEKRKKPLILLFYGPTGVGKTETARFLSKELGGELFRQQFSMFQNERAYNYLFGDSIGKNSFSYDLINRETNVILLDEFDKVSQYLYSAFYELFDEGIFDDNTYNVNMEKSIIILTSNYKNEEEIEIVLGSPIYSRIDSKIKFDKLSHETKVKVSEDAVNSLYDELEDKYQKIVNKEIVKMAIIKRIESLADVRTVKGDVEKMFNIMILNNLLEDTN